MKENYRVKPWIVLYKFNYSPKLTIEPLPRMMAGGRGGGAGRSKLSDNGRTIFKISYQATGEQQFVLKIRLDLRTQVASVNDYQRQKIYQ